MSEAVRAIVRGELALRRALVKIHRWTGLVISVFLFVAGLTGAIIAWEHELDAWLNPHLYYAESGSEVWVSPLELADLTEQNDPNALVTYLPLGIEHGHGASVHVSPRPSLSGDLPSPELDYSQVVYDPGTGKEQGRRLWGAFSIAPENLLPFIYKLHYSLHLPDIGALQFGGLLMGLIAIAWTIDCFVAIWIAFPKWKRWRESFKFHFDKGWKRANFDLHRSGGVWPWFLLLAVAFTAVSMNLGPYVTEPLVSLVSPLTPNPYTVRAGKIEADGRPLLTRAQVVDIAKAEALQLDIAGPPGAVFFSPGSALYGVGFFEPGDDHADGKIANPWLAIDAYSGDLVRAEMPWEGTAGDVFMQMQFPVHSGRIFGVAGRVGITLLGLIIAMLSVTGIIMWARRQSAQHKKRQRERAKAQDLKESDSAASPIQAA